MLKQNNNSQILLLCVEVVKELLMLNFCSNRRKMPSLQTLSRNLMTLNKNKARSRRKMGVQWLMSSEKKESRQKKLLLKNKFLKLNQQMSVAVDSKLTVIY